MTKYILPAIAALGLVVSPAVSMAQGGNKADSDSEGKMKMKGPPNADGYKGEKGAGGGKDDNGAASAKATGEDKK